MGIYGHKFDSFRSDIHPELAIKEESNILSFAYEEYLNKKSLLEACTDENERLVLETQVDILHEISVKDIKQKFIDLIKEFKKKLIAIGSFIKRKFTEIILNRVVAFIKKLKGVKEEAEKKEKEESDTVQPKESKSEEKKEDSRSEPKGEIPGLKKEKIKKADIKIYYLDINRFLNWKIDTVANWLNTTTLEHQTTMQIEHWEDYLVLDDQPIKEIFKEGTHIGKIHEVMAHSDFMTSMQRFSFLGNEDDMKKQPIFKYLNNFNIEIDTEKDPFYLFAITEFEKWEKILKEDSDKLDQIQKVIMKNLDEVEKKVNTLDIEKLPKDIYGTNIYQAMKDIMSANIDILECTIRLINASVSQISGIQGVIGL